MLCPVAADASKTKRQPDESNTITTLNLLLLLLLLFDFLFGSPFGNIAKKHIGGVAKASFEVCDKQAVIQFTSSPSQPLLQWLLRLDLTPFLYKIPPGLDLFLA
eukprot:GHVT01053109.1.p2 GENE.GHVT01053109.1~~GHVT01053109.1.p2  ORF type:complete len:104 (-),score=8.41 GHVT01053109.1:3-314(-)